MQLYTILFHNTTPIHCTPLPLQLPPCNEYPSKNSDTGLRDLRPVRQTIKYIHASKRTDIDATLKRSPRRARPRPGGVAVGRPPSLLSGPDTVLLCPYTILSALYSILYANLCYVLYTLINDIPSFSPRPPAPRGSRSGARLRSGKGKEAPASSSYSPWARS